MDPVVAAEVENVPAAADQAPPEPVRKRQKAYAAMQLGIIKKAHIEDKLGRRKIVKKYPDMNLTEQGVKDAIARLKKKATWTGKRDPVDRSHPARRATSRK